MNNEVFYIILFIFIFLAYIACLDLIMYMYSKNKGITINDAYKNFYKAFHKEEIKRKEALDELYKSLLKSAEK